MSIHSPRRRIDRRTAEQLLDAPSAGAPTSHPQLAALLAAAAAPGRPHELGSEEATVAAFRTARHVAVPRPRGLSVVRKVAMKALTVKVLAVLATTTAGGVALAASTGALPNPLAQPAHPVSSGLSAADPTATRTAAASPRDSRAADPASSSSPDSAAPSKAPSPKLLALCRAYQVGDKLTHGKALDNPAFKDLITAAGGKDKVPPYCQALIASAARNNDGNRRDGGRGQSGGGHDRDTRTPRPTLVPGQ